MTVHNLTGRYRAALVPSSMSPGTTISDDPHLSMTAPGSPSINPPPGRLGQLPMPVLAQVPLPVNTPQREEPDAGRWQPAQGSAGAGRWTTAYHPSPGWSSHPEGLAP